MKKWFDEDYEFELEVRGFLRGDKTEGYCRNGEEIGDSYKCTYGCPTNSQGQGICSKMMMILFPLMEAVRSGGAKWRRFAKFRRRKQIQQGYSLPRWLRDFQTHS